MEGAAHRGKALLGLLLAVQAAVVDAIVPQGRQEHLVKVMPVVITMLNQQAAVVVEHLLLVKIQAQVALAAQEQRLLFLDLQLHMLAAAVVALVFLAEAAETAAQAAVALAVVTEVKVLPRQQIREAAVVVALMTEAAETAVPGL